MEVERHARVAVLLATYNGGRFVGPQIRSLKENSTRFTLHWLDDHSTDGTRDAVIAAARNSEIDLREWHQAGHQGVPGAFFQLMERVEADIYLFCDQDDIWQPGKIDATVANLQPDLASAVLCFSDPLVFKEDEPRVTRRLSDITSVKSLAALRRSSMFLVTPAMGHTIGFTRPLREIFLKHKGIARKYAAMHDTWMYLIAIASGTARMLPDAPTTLYRLHGRNTAGMYFGWLGWGGVFHFSRKWRVQQWIRRIASRQAEGFRLAAGTLTRGPKLDQLLEVARLIERIDRRQPPATLARLVRSGALPPGVDFAMWFLAACLCSDANA